MKHKAFRILHLVLTLVILASVLGLPSSVVAATTNVLAWGNNSYGQLGYPPPPLYSTEPVRVNGVSNVTSVSVIVMSLLFYNLYNTVNQFIA